MGEFYIYVLLLIVVKSIIIHFKIILHIRMEEYYILINLILIVVKLIIIYFKITLHKLMEEQYIFILI
jgi:hypothetical protein